MDRKDYICAGGLLALAVFIWGRDLRWMSTAENTVPVVAALVVFWWLGRPWHFRPRHSELCRVHYAGAGALLFVAGIGLDVTFLLALGWVLLLSCWLAVRLVRERWQAVKGLLILPLMAFPWLAVEGGFIGWWFRLSGAWAAGVFYSALGLGVEREGTFLIVQGLPMQVDAACAGLNELQALLIAGTVAAYFHIGHHKIFRWSLLLLVFMAWASNTTRIVMLGITALTVSPEFATGAFHTWGGWLVLCMMFLLCWRVFGWLQRKDQAPLVREGARG